MQNEPALAVSLVSGLRGAGKSRVASILSGGSCEPNPGDVIGDDEADASELAMRLAGHLLGLADSGLLGDVVIELQSPADPAEVALILEQAFAAQEPDERGVAIREIVTVARATDIRRLLFRSGPEHVDDDFDTSEQLATQLEYATAIVLTGMDECCVPQLREIHGLLTKLNPTAVISTLATAPRLRRRRQASATLAADLGRHMGWMLELSGRSGPPITVNTVNTFVFRDPRPFHPGRLAEVVAHCLEPDDVGLILRSRGLVRLASRPAQVGSWTSAGAVLAINPTGMTSWDPDSPIGQELVFVGRNLRPERIARALRAALLGDDELIAGPMEWANYADPFPAWDVHHDHDH